MRYLKQLIIGIILVSIFAFILFTYFSNSSDESQDTYTFEELKNGNLQGILHGSGPLWTINEAIEYREAFSDTKPYLVRTGIGLSNINQANRYTIDEKIEKLSDYLETYFSDELHFLTISYVDENQYGEPLCRDKEVVEGYYDEEIKKIAQFVKEDGRPTFCRIASEFNGWWSNCSIDYYADSYRRIVDIFRQEGDNNTIFMWNFMSVPEYFPYMDWYPGDDYVDWWSQDIFGEHFSNEDSNKHMMEFLEDASEHGKPVMIPESCPSTLDINSQSTWDNWFNPYFNLINNDPNIKGFCYSNRDFSNHGGLEHWGDMRIDKSELKDLYDEELLKSKYIHSS